jgi:hypothetical protein
MVDKEGIEKSFSLCLLRGDVIRRKEHNTTRIQCSKFGVVFTKENCAVCELKRSYDAKKDKLKCRYIEEVIK